MTFLTVQGLAARYGTIDVLSGIDLSIARGEILALIGPSGSGKSTLLRTLVGLIRPHAGHVVLDEERIDYGSKASLKRARDRFAIVFQQYNLFQNMTALRNVTIAPTIVKGRARGDVETEARDLLAKVGLSAKVGAYPDELSGGQQQRVAIARALALKPDVLLLDEVTSALDPELVTEVLDTIRALGREGMTMIIVSHEMGFVREVASRVAFMDQGKIVEIGKPDRIFDAPETERLKDFTAKILRH
ncbi:amino acid ABC transporter ATP-binding protein [Phreatobacter aquaticus]|uniref:Amino acid ABC transporter ATP-binding protein n=1 Tax=Phreatobacter aquaticus TaxID=2570229 RepID=A0A4D7QRF9_9HYPH|nr:amino acid ABC transporter ATP-binding protein [Phreatobacter aquaticus]QCK87834.1 amino acid ABC transporter ATP-binding protein [Phreatobacter aquaticus]